MSATAGCAVWLLLAVAVRGDGVVLGHLTASGGADGDAFGGAVAIGEDWLVVSAPHADGPFGDCGAVTVFRREGLGWTEQAKLTASDAGAGDHFGGSLALDGDVLVVGARDDTGAAGEGAGSAYVFAWDGAGWCEQAKLVASDAAQGDSFGCSVGLDGGSVVVGAYASDSPAASSGAAYVFALEDDAWREQAKLTTGEPAKGQYFGCSVAIDGERIAVGARGENGIGAAHVFERSGESWTETACCVASDAVAGNYVGRRIALDGDWLVASASGDDPCGSAQVFHYDGSGWAEQAKLTVAWADELDHLACDVAIDGEDVILGAWGDDGAGTDAGCAYVFCREGDTWRQAGKLTVPDDPGGRLGSSVAVRDGCVVAGAAGGDDWPLVPGSATVFATGTRSLWRASSGQWSDPNHWTAGVPTGGTDATVEGPASVAVESGAVSARALTVGPEASLTAEAGAEIHLRGSLRIAATDPESVDLSRATVVFESLASGEEACCLEVAGRDLGPDPAGWSANFVLGSLVIGAGAAVRLVDDFDNVLADGEGEALYVTELVIAPEGRLDLNGLKLYYLNAGWGRELLVGDADLDGDVDRLDLLALRGSFGQAAPAGWRDGDCNGDGRIDSTDYLVMKDLLGSRSPGQPPVAPEPATGVLALLGAAMLARCRTPRGPSKRRR